MTIYVVEIPHQRPATAWTAENEQDFINSVAAASTDTNSYWHEEDGTVEWYEGGEMNTAPVAEAPSEFEYWKSVLTDDLHMGIVTDDLNDAYDSIKNISHQQGAALTALERVAL